MRFYYTEKVREQITQDCRDIKAARLSVSDKDPETSKLRCETCEIVMKTIVQGDALREIGMDYYTDNSLRGLYTIWNRIKDTGEVPNGYTMLDILNERVCWNEDESKHLIEVAKTSPQRETDRFVASRLESLFDGLHAYDPYKDNPFSYIPRPAKGRASGNTSANNGAQK